MTHAAEAERALSVLDGVHGSDLSLDEMIAAAQVHATLALVEQQRIANLIAIYGSEGEVESGYGSKGVDFGFIVDEIRGGLGL